MVFWKCAKELIIFRANNILMKSLYRIELQLYVQIRPLCSDKLRFYKPQKTQRPFFHL